MTISKDSLFTGLFKAKEQIFGLIRMGPAGDLSKKDGIVPGISLKFLRSGTMSANIVALILDAPKSLPNKNYNFFAETFSNQIGDKVEGLKAKIAAARFCTTGNLII